MSQLEVSEFLYRILLSLGNVISLKIKLLRHYYSLCSGSVCSMIASLRMNKQTKLIVNFKLLSHPKPASFKIFVSQISELMHTII